MLLLKLVLFVGFLVNTGLLASTVHFTRLQYRQDADGMMYPDKSGYKNWFTDFNDGSGKSMYAQLATIVRRLTQIDIEP